MVLRNPFRTRGDYSQEKLLRDLRDLVESLNKENKSLEDRVKSLEDRVGVLEGTP